MNFMKRALYSVTRKKGKSIILFAVVFILGNVIAGAISIKQATASVEKNIKSQLGATATFSFDFKEANKLSEESSDGGNQFATPSVKVIRQIAELPYVKSYDYNISSYAQTNKLKSYSLEDENSGGMMAGGAGKYILFLKGVNDPEIYDITNKKIKLISGRVFKKDEVESGKSVAIISQQFATTNNLSVGDKMVIDNNEISMPNSDIGVSNEENQRKETVDILTQDYIYEIIGVFEPIEAKVKEAKKDDDMGTKSMFDEQLLNTIYAPNNIIKANQDDFLKRTTEKFPENYEGMLEDMQDDYYGAIFTLKKPEDVEAFKEEAGALLPNKVYKILASSDKYDSIAAPVKSMAKISQYVIVIAVAAALLIISLVVLLFLRDRKHELGIYLSLGEKRGKVLSQVLIEVLLISFVAITLSVFTGNFLAKGVSSSLIETQLKAKADEGVDYNEVSKKLEYYSMGTADIDESDISKSYEVSLTPTYILIFYVVGLSTILLSTIVPLIYILRLNPKKIMM